MSDFDRGLSRPASVAAPDMSVDVGLRGFMLGVYNKVALGLVLSAALAWVTGNVPAVTQMLWRVSDTGRYGFTTLGMIVAFAPLGLILFQAFARRQSAQAAGFIYWSVTTLIGAGLGVWFLRFTDAKIFETFLVTAIAFGGLSIFGYTTKRDLGPMRSFLIMGLVGLIFALIALMLLHSGAFAFVINIVGVIIFAGLIAADTQNLKMMYYQIGGDTAAMGVATNRGALRLYLDFVNLFQFLLMLMGGGRR